MEVRGTNNGYVMKIHIGNVNKPIIEDIADERFMDTAIFGRQYKQMLTLLERYVKNRKDRNENEEAPNNVFSFVGERGSGKTSCMSSISKLLANGKIHQFKAYEYLRQTSFATIDIIDPSYFDEKHNIVSMFVAKLYKSFTQLERENERESCDFDKYDTLIDAFAKTQRNMQCLLESHSEEEYDEVERLSDLAMAVNLKNDIQYLVQTYLRFVKKEKGVLILSIDDIDLNISEADTMAEQIRKYLVSPNIIILLAAKLDQLATIKNLHYAEKYKYLMDANYLSYNTVEDMTGQFITKFAPHDQRVYMPSVDFYLESSIKIEEDTMFGDSVKQAIPELIFKKTRYLFYNSKQTASYVIPRNLRKMCQLVAMLWAMGAYDTTNLNDNKQVFRNYLFGSWLQDNLQQKDRLYVQRLLDGWKNEQLNKIALDVLRDKYSNWIKDKLNANPRDSESRDVQDEIGALFDDQNREFNFSVGDVMSLVSLLQVSNDTHADKCFFFILKSIYSMALYESYDIITDEQDNEGYDEFTDNKVVEKRQVLLYDPFSDEHVSAYHRLVGGRFFNYRLSPVLPKETIKNSINSSASYKVSRTDRMINFESLRALIEDAVNSWELYKTDSVHQNDVTDGVQIKQKIRLAEFFMLCTIRDINRKNAKNTQDYYNPEFRRSNSVYYNGDYSSKSWLYFDLGAFFYNITCMCACYQRFGNLGKKLLKLCQEDETTGISLFASFRNNAKKYREGYKQSHAWQSWASIRNAEILFDLNQMLQSKCRNTDSNNRKSICKFFDTLADYNIYTYDRDDKGTNLNINFEFASEIRDLLNNNVEADFDRIFAWAMEDVETYSIDLDSILKGRFNDRNKKGTILQYMVNHYPFVSKNFGPLIDNVFGNYGNYMTRNEIKEAVTQLNMELMNKTMDSYGSH